MDETREVEVTNTHIQYFECGCTTAIKKTAPGKPPQMMCNAHQGLLVGEETIKEYAVGPTGYSTSGSVARSIPGA